MAVRTKKGKSTFFEISENNKLIPISSEASRYSFDFDGKSYLNNRSWIVGFSYGEDEIYVIENLETDKFVLVAYNYKKNSISKIYEDNKYDVGSPGVGIELIYNHKEKTLAGIRYEKEKSTTIWFDEKIKKIQEKIDKKYPKKINTIIQRAGPAGRVLFDSRDDLSGGRVLVYLPDANKMLVQAEHPPVLSWAAPVTKVIEYESRDGHFIEAYLTLPIVDKGERFPLIVMPHGGPFVRDHYVFNPYVQYFASQGYAVIQPNYRGSPGYGRAHLMGGKGSINNVMISDISDSARWAIANENVDTKRVHIFGFSYGGYAAILSAINESELYRSAASYSAPLDIKSQLEWYKKNDNHFASEFWVEMLLSGNTSGKFLKSISPLHQIENIKIPLLIFHGGVDFVVPFEQARKFKNKLKKIKNKNKGLDVTVLKLNTEMHVIHSKRNRIYLAEKVLEHFKK